jgi:DNA repair exonuclease SbcCD ATPase subunit
LQRFKKDKATSKALRALLKNQKKQLQETIQEHQKKIEDFKKANDLDKVVAEIKKAGETLDSVYKKDGSGLNELGLTDTQTTEVKEMLKTEKEIGEKVKDLNGKMDAIRDIVSSESGGTLKPLILFSESGGTLKPLIVLSEVIRNSN